MGRLLFHCFGVKVQPWIRLGRTGIRNRIPSWHHPSLFSQLPVHPRSCHTPRKDGADGNVRSGNSISACIDSLLFCPEGFQVGLDQPSGGFKLFPKPLSQEIQVHPLAGCQYDGICLDECLLRLLIYRGKAVFPVENRQAFFSCQAGDLFVFVRDHFSQAPAMIDLHPLFLCPCNLLRRGRHLMFLLQADQLHMLSSQAGCGKGHIHCHVSAPAYKYLASNGLFQICVDFHQEVQAKLGQVLSLQTQHRLFPGAGPHVHPVGVFPDLL